MLDIDGFKGINDAHGHKTGDRAMKALAALRFPASEVTRGRRTVGELRDRRRLLDHRTENRW